MRVCPVCRREYENETICPGCMIPLIDTDMEKAVNTYEEETAQKKQQKEEKKKERETRQEPAAKRERPDQSGRTSAPEKRERSASSSVNMASIDPKYIVILVVIIFIVIAVIFIVRGRNSDTDTVQNDTTAVTATTETNAYTDTDQETQETEETEEADLSEVDIDAVSDSYAEFTGTLSTRGGEYMVKLDTAYNIYAYNDSGEQTVMKNVNQIILNDTGGWDLAGYVDGEVTVCGYLEISDQDMTMTLIDFFGTAAEDTAIHEYQIIIDDCTWEEALKNAESMGGYLVRINTAEEYDFIINLLSGGNYSTYHFYLGGRRNSDGTEYYWVDENNQFMGECLNTDSSWCADAWYNGEPSYVDTGSDASSLIQEDTMNLFCVGGTWYLNDASGDLPGNYPDLLSGKVGYIVEVE